MKKHIYEFKIDKITYSKSYSRTMYNDNIINNNNNNIPAVLKY